MDDADELTISGDYTISGWCKPDDLTQDHLPIFAWGTYNTSGSITMFAHGASSYPQRYLTVLSGTTYLNSSGAVFAADTWVHIMLSRSGSTITLYVNGSANTTWTNSSNYNQAVSWQWGQRYNSTVYTWSGRLAEWAKWDSALTSGNASSLAGGATPDTIGSPAWYVDMWDRDAVTLDCEAGDLTLTASNIQYDPFDEPIGRSGAVPYKASVPFPVDDQAASGVDPVLEWTDTMGGATSFDVYFGTDSTPDETELVSDGQEGTTYDAGDLIAGTTYYWRIDSVNADGTTTGDVWTFTVRSLPAGTTWWATTDGTGDGTSASTPMAWSDVAAETSSGDNVIINGLALVSANVDTVWPAGRIYYTQEISQWGITWTLDKEYRVGQYCTGDIWVVGPAVIVGISPESTNVAGRIANGSMVNPMPTDTTQGYDNAGSIYSLRPYAAARNAAYDVSPSKVLQLAVNSSLVSTISVVTSGQMNQLQRAAILTVVSSVPASGSFRPPYVGTSKAMAYKDTDLDYSILQNVSAATGAPTLATAEDYMEATWLDYLSDEWGRGVHPTLSMPDYGSQINSRVGTCALMLHVNNTDAAKATLYKRFVQYGLDLWGVENNGGAWGASGGHNNGRKWPMVLAGLALDVSAMQTITGMSEDASTFYVSASDVTNTYDQQLTGNQWTYRAASPYISGTITAGNTITQATTGASGTVVAVFNGTNTNGVDDWITIEWSGSGNDFDVTGTYLCTDQTAGGTFTPAYRCRWDLGGTWQPDYGTRRDNEIIPYVTDDIGTPEWSIQYAYYPERANAYGNTIYRYVSQSFNGTALAAAMTEGGKAAWDYPAYFDYTERFQTAYAAWGMTRSETLWEADMWDTYWATYENYDWPEDPVPTKFLRVRKPTP